MKKKKKPAREIAYISTSNGFNNKIRGIFWLRNLNSPLIIVSLQSAVHQRF